MKKIDKEYNIQRYQERYQKHGYSPLSLGWGNNNKQEFRFSVIKEIGISSTDSVLDIGCGFGDLYQFLKKDGYQGKYTGIDIVEELLDEARIQFSGIDVRNINILDGDFNEEYDWVVCSGIFNAKLKSKLNYEFIKQMLDKMVSLSKKGVSADFLSKFVDFQQDLNFHTDPNKIFNIANCFSKRIIIRHDYLPYEFSVYVFKDDSINKGANTFLNGII